MRVSLAAVLLIALIASAPAQEQTPKNQSPRTIVFVCEHGAALSVISAAYFNKFATEHRLNWHAIARGVTPQENLSVSAEAGLKKDGVPSEVRKPSVITQDDLARADYVVTFLPLPEKLVVHTPVENWYDVQWTPQDYDKARDGILRHMHELLQTLRTKPRAGTS